MQSKTSWFNATLYRKNMARFWPIWGLYAAIWVLLFPVKLLTYVYDPQSIYQSGMTYIEYFADLAVLDMNTISFPMTAVVSLLAAMAVFSYLYQSKSTGMMHALPVKREGLFFTSYLSGISFLLLPAVGTFLLTLAAEAIKGYVNFGALCMWLTIQVLSALFFFSFATFCAMFTGHILALPMFYGVLNFLAPGFVSLMDGVANHFVYGIAGQSMRVWYDYAEWLSPIIKLMRMVHSSSVWDGEVAPTVTFYGLQYAIVYAVVGLVLAGLALAVYRRRNLESAGDVVSVGWVKPVFKYGVGLCTALSLGTLLYGIFQNGLPHSPWVILCFMSMSAITGYFGAEMLLQKSVRVWKSWKGCVALVLVLVVGAAVIDFDLTGFEGRIPDPSQIASVRLDSSHSYPRDSFHAPLYAESDADSILVATKLHAAILAERGIEVGYQSESVTPPNGYMLTDVSTADMCYVQITYTLKNGKPMIRSYYVNLSNDLLAQPDSAAAQLSFLLNRPNVRVDSYFNQRATEGQLINVSISDAASDRWQSIGGNEQEAILAAVKADLAAGRLGQRYLLDNLDRMINCYYNDLNFTFRVNPSSAEQSSMSSTSQSRSARDSQDSRTENITITLQTTATETLAVLERLGVLDQVSLITQLEYRQQQQQDAAKAEATYD